MKNNIEERTLVIAKECVRTKKTVRELAKDFKLSKSTIHKDLTERLYYVNKQLYYKVQNVLQNNKNERAQRGGEATRRKYVAMKNS